MAEARRNRVSLAQRLFLIAALISGPACQQTSPTYVAEPAQVALHLAEMDELAGRARELARAAPVASTIDEIKQHADELYALVWGAPSGLLEGSGAAAHRGWKTRWQVTYTDFDPEFGARYGGTPPAVTDPAQLGIAGRGRYVRRQLVDAGVTDDASRAVLDALNNVIGWMRMDDGVTKAERQPRVDLTYRWDAPKSFWQSSADTGWLFEVQAQALNILKTDYAGDAGLAREHAAALGALVDKCLNGATIDGVRHGGLVAVRNAAREAGLR